MRAEFFSASSPPRAVAARCARLGIVAAACERARTMALFGRRRGRPPSHTLLATLVPSETTTRGGRARAAPCAPRYPSTGRQQGSKERGNRTPHSHRARGMCTGTADQARRFSCCRLYYNSGAQQGATARKPPGALGGGWWRRGRIAFCKAGIVLLVLRNKNAPTGGASELEGGQVKTKDRTFCPRAVTGGPGRFHGAQVSSGALGSAVSACFGRI